MDPNPQNPPPKTDQPTDTTTPQPPMPPTNPPSDSPLTPSTPPTVPEPPAPPSPVPPTTDTPPPIPNPTGIPPSHETSSGIPPDNQQPAGADMPKPNNKKTAAIAAAGISGLLIILGVYAMTRDSFTTNTDQQAAAIPTQAITPTSAYTPTPSDPAERDLSGIEDELKSVDQETMKADETLQATPPDLE